MADWWQHIPRFIDPVALVIGPFVIRWYAVCFVGGFFAAVGYLLSRIRSGESSFDAGTVWDASMTAFLGIILGGRLGFALFYEPSLFFNPLTIFSPVDGTGRFVGIRGMSFFGALIGVSVALGCYIRLKRLSFGAFSDFFASAVPIALFVGRIGNFLNLELPGRMTAVPWAMYAPDPSTGAWQLRHPSQLYEALLEGLFLFVLLVWFRKRNSRNGLLTLLFLSGYALTRFLVEFFREPDLGSQIFFGWMTEGQALSLILLVIAASVALAIGLKPVRRPSR
ncbi:MAG TPA: prolipoprotein diacylglyceryl transferase [Candidatus Fimivivens sp.]|nr:prolipoprotein diacylglyceryl transferase [Candidatus Fimivivens sp.]